MKKEILYIATFLLGTTAMAQDKPEDTEVWNPEPKVVTGTSNNQVPSDAISLFDGSNLDAWIDVNTRQATTWKLEEENMIVVPGSGYIESKQSFGDIQLHLEWKTPTQTEGFSGQDRGNSGIFFQSRYEVQILDSYQNRTYANGQAGAIYKQYPPLVNAMNKPGEWQIYDIVFEAPKFNDDGSKKSSGYLTVFHNGVIIQNHMEILGTTEYIGAPKNIAHGNAPILIQDHDHPISFRNIWVRELNANQSGKI